MFEFIEVTYPTVSRYTSYFDSCPELLGSALKEVQRGWVFDTCRCLLRPGAKILDLGGSACELANYMSEWFDMWVIDPYDGSGNGPRSPKSLRQKFPNLHIIQGFLTDKIDLSGFDAVLSTSVVEHIDTEAYSSTVAGIAHVLKPGGYSIHAIDHTVRGVNGFLEYTGKRLEDFARLHGGEINIEQLRRKMLDDPDTYFL